MFWDLSILRGGFKSVMPDFPIEKADRRSDKGDAQKSTILTLTLKN